MQHRMRVLLEECSRACAARAIRFRIGGLLLSVNEANTSSPPFTKWSLLLDFFTWVSPVDVMQFWRETSHDEKVVIEHYRGSSSFSNHISKGQSTIEAYCRAQADMQGPVKENHTMNTSFAWKQNVLNMNNNAITKNLFVGLSSNTENLIFLDETRKSCRIVYNGHP
jgi:hypothetical protein